jgi:hypothetical protein
MSSLSPLGSHLPQVLGFPRILSVGLKVKHSELFTKIWAAVGFYCTDESCSAENPPYDILLSDYAGMLTGTKIECDDTVSELQVPSAASA